MTPPPLSETELAPFARVLRGEAGRMLAVPEVLEVGDTPGRHGFFVLSPRPAEGDFASIAFLERHPQSTQTFIPMRVSRWLVLVAPDLPDGSPDLGAMKAFIAGPEDAICIRRNVWHAGLTVFDRPAEFAMIMWRTDDGDDGDVHTLADPIEFSAD